MNLMVYIQRIFLLKALSEYSAGLLTITLTPCVFNETAIHSEFRSYICIWRLPKFLSKSYKCDTEQSNK